MKSLMVTNADYINDKSGYTDLQILKSAAGYFIGTLFEERDVTGKVIFVDMGSRDSDYFKTEEDAKIYLKTIESSGEDIAAIVLRNHP